jgi:hypothetical protein
VRFLLQTVNIRILILDFCIVCHLYSLSTKSNFCEIGTNGDLKLLINYLDDLLNISLVNSVLKTPPLDLVEFGYSVITCLFVDINEQSKILEIYRLIHVARSLETF